MMRVWPSEEYLDSGALREVLPDARAGGLRYVEITTAVDNIASQRVIAANGGLVEEFVTPPSLAWKRHGRSRTQLQDGEPTAQRGAEPVRRT